MKKIIGGAALFAALLAVAPTAQAQNSSGLSYGVSGGLILPVGKLGDEQGSGFNLQGLVTLKPNSIPLAFRGELGAFTVAGKTPTVRVGGNATPSVTWVSAIANAIYAFEGSKDDTFVPYIIGGIGLYSATKQFGTGVGVNAGGGVTFKLSGFDAFAEARFHNISSDFYTSRMIPITFGINFKP